MTKNLNFIHQNASGMSVRNTRTAPESVQAVSPTVVPFYIDPSNGEMDAGATNVGLISPYAPPPPEPPTQFPPHEDISPLYINGQRVTATLDGMAISWQMVRNLIDHGAAVPVGIDNILRAARGRDINLQYTGSGRYTFRDFNSTYDGPGSRYIGVTFDFSFNFGIQQTQKTNEFKFYLVWHPGVARDKSLLDRIKAVVFDAKALSDECTKAFQAAGATPIKDQLADQNINFVTESIFTDPNEDDGWAPDKVFANGLRETANSTKRKYLGIFEMTGQIEASDITQKGIYKGNRYIGLTNWGIDQNLDHLSVTIIHALVHSGGIGPQQQSGTHDLAYLGEKYDAIIEACQKNESKVKKAERK